MTCKTTLPRPPRLSMTEYADFVSANWKNGNRDQMRRQKEIEKQIEKPFRMPSSPTRAASLPLARNMVTKLT